MSVLCCKGWLNDNRPNVRIKVCQSLNKHYKDDDDDDMAAYVAPQKDKGRGGKEGGEKEIGTPCFVWP